MNICSWLSEKTSAVQDFQPHFEFCTSGYWMTLDCNRIRQLKTRRFWGDGLQSRDFIHVDDIARGIILGYQSKVGALPNLTGQLTGPGMQDSVGPGPNHSNHSKISNFFWKFCWNFEIWAVRRIANLVDLEKCWKMSIWLQKSASIQPRTSLLKFDDLARTKVRYRIFLRFFSQIIKL